MRREAGVGVKGGARAGRTRQGDAPRHVAVVVDNPPRDLAGLVLTAAELVRRGCVVSLVPMYDFRILVPRLGPDLVLLNWCRERNRGAIRRLRWAGFRLAVLDTEGGILRSTAELLDSVRNSGVVEMIDAYCLWGRRQFEDMRTMLAGAVTPRLHLTGSPRFDFYVPDLAAALEGEDAPTGAEDGYVLIPTSFPFCNPRYGTPESEVLAVHDATGAPVEELRQAVVAAREAFDKTLPLLHELFGRYPNQPFVLRPHPFERREVYREAFGRYPNVRIEPEGSLHGWLRRARLVVQLNSSAAVEARLLGRDVIALEMFQDPRIAVETSSRVSLRPRDRDGFFALFDALLAGRPAPEPYAAEMPAYRAALADIVADWLHAVDGRSAARVADVLVEALDGDPRRASSPLRRRLLYGEALARRAAKWLAYRLDPRPGGRTRKDKEAERRRSKRFAGADVAAILGRLPDWGAGIAVGERTMLRGDPLFETTCVTLNPFVARRNDP